MAKNKSKSTWGGSWTEQKLITFEKYVKAYLTIMNTHRDKYEWKLIYFDAFAGSGHVEKKDYEKCLAKFDIELSETEVYKGAAERVLAIEKRGFDYYYFIDKDENASNSLKQKLLAGNDDPRLQFRVGKASDYIIRFGQFMQQNRHYKALALLDPFGMQVDWKSLQALEGTGTDIWILLPSGVAINRLLDRDGTLTHIDKITDYFGLPQKDIQSRFYNEKTEDTLFGEQTKQSKIEKPIKQIANIYEERLKTIFKYVSSPFALRNSRNVPIYHFVFASNNKTASKIADNIIGKE